jgi:hypothetical protein
MFPIPTHNHNQMYCLQLFIQNKKYRKNLTSHVQYLIHIFKYMSFEMKHRVEHLLASSAGADLRFIIQVKYTQATV